MVFGIDRMLHQAFCNTLFIAMIVAYFVAHAKDPFELKQLAFIYLMLPVVVFLQGSGKYSVDALLFAGRVQT